MCFTGKVPNVYFFKIINWIIYDHHHSAYLKLTIRPASWNVLNISPQFTKESTFTFTFATVSTNSAGSLCALLWKMCSCAFHDCVFRDIPYFPRKVPKHEFTTGHNESFTNVYTRSQVILWHIRPFTPNMGTKENRKRVSLRIRITSDSYAHRSEASQGRICETTSAWKPWKTRNLNEI